MPRGKKELTEQITPELREVEVEVGRGKTVTKEVKKIGATEQTDSLGRARTRPPKTFGPAWRSRPSVSGGSRERWREDAARPEPLVSPRRRFASADQLNGPLPHGSAGCSW
jgi:hypothetical protein